jgi:hypothetical protein
VAAPTGSSVTQLNDATTAYPDFTPDVPGDYAISEGGTVRLHVYAGTYAGALDAPATPAAGCTSCHAGRFAAWLQTGHKEVIWAGIAEALPDGHYTKTCTPCHTVGNGRTGSAGFADKMALDNPDFAALQGDLNAEQDYWGLYPASAKVAGVQCENCHGPQTGTTKHMTSATGGDILSPRVSFSANVCATCHARAPKHGRFPQWAESGHASMATFTFNSNPDGSLSASCAVCHSAQGFKAFRKAMAQPGWIGNRSVVTLAAGAGVTTAEPITCAACHDSHSEGDKSTAGWSNLAAVGPTEGSTYILPSGFTAIGVGKGALCIACHNSRQGYSAAFSVGTGPGTTVNYPAAVYLHEDGDPKFGTLTSYGAPHEACQGDVLLGRNGYWLGAALRGSPQTRSKHSYITDTCVTCHMELTTLDLTLSEPGQTRHDFKATPDVCNKCHTAYSTESVASTFDASLDGLKTAVGTAILRLKYDDAIPAGTTAALVANRSGQVDVTTAGITRRWFLKTATGLDAYLSDPSNGGALPQGCVAGTAGTFDCTGFLAGAPGVTAIGASATQDATVTSSGVNGVIAKALWNTVLVQDDASHGVHNPSFSLEVIDATVQHVNGYTK